MVQMGMIKCAALSALLLLASSALAEVENTNEVALEIKTFQIGELKKLEPASTTADLSSLTFTGPEGEPATIADFRGRIVLLNLWATWCPPCLKELPSINRLVEKLSAEGLSERVSVIALNTDQGGPNKARDFLNTHKLTLLSLFHAPGFAAPRAVGARGLPTTLLIDHQGREIARLEGDAEWDAAEVVALLRAASKQIAASN